MIHLILDSVGAIGQPICVAPRIAMPMATAMTIGFSARYPLRRRSNSSCAGRGALAAPRPASSALW